MWLLHSGFLINLCIHFSLDHTCYMPHTSYPPQFDCPNKYDKKYKLWSYLLCNSLLLPVAVSLSWYDIPLVLYTQTTPIWISFSKRSIFPPITGILVIFIQDILILKQTGINSWINLFPSNKRDIN
jgi:hypothetical protein